jgi:hypothetical protein
LISTFLFLRTRTKQVLSEITFIRYVSEITFIRYFLK